MSTAITFCSFSSSSSFFFFFLLLLNYPLASAKTCPPCGNTTVPYPLSTSPNCGDPLYKIRCQSQSLFFEGANGTTTYTVKSIDPSTQRLVVKPAPFLSSTTCVTTDFQGQGFTLNSSLPFNITGTNTLMYLNCTDTLLLSPLNCTSISPCHSYINATGDGEACRDTTTCCTLQAGGGSTSYQIKTSGTGCSAYRSFVGLDLTAPVTSWTGSEGVELQWMSPREPLCQTQADCEAGSNAICALDVTGGKEDHRCFCVDGLVWNPFSGTCIKNVTDCETSGNCGGPNHVPLVAGLSSGLAAGLLFSISILLYQRRGRHIKAARDRIAKEREEILNANNSSGRTAHNFTGKEIKRATGNFSRDNLLGAGGYGEVFKGTIHDGTPVAVKIAKIGNTKSTDQVLNEVRILSQVNHRSVVRLLGCCVELEQPLMVYEFISNGTLFEHLHRLRPSELKPLSWRERLSIAHQTAEGLAYLHFSAVPPIYHRDVKSSNILLDEKLNAKVADFGLSRLAVTDLSHVSTCAQGTLGYLDPEYYRNYQLTDKSDVYSFGVVLLELLTSKKAIDFGRDADNVNLAICVQQHVEEERLMDVVDPLMKEGATQLEVDTMKALGFLAVSCLEEKRQNRPSMNEVAEEIGYIISLEAGSIHSTTHGCMK